MNKPFDSTKTFKVRSSATRYAKKFGIKPGQYTVEKIEDGTFCITGATIAELEAIVAAAQSNGMQGG